MPSTQACPWSARHSAFEWQVLLTGAVLGAPAMAWPAGPPATESSGGEVRQSSLKHSLLEQPPKAELASKAKLVSKAKKVMRKTAFASAGPTTTGPEARPETIRESAELLTGRSTGLPCSIVLGFAR